MDLGGHQGFRLIAAKVGSTGRVDHGRPVSLGNPFPIHRHHSDAVPAEFTRENSPVRSILHVAEQLQRLFAEFSLTRLRQYRHNPHFCGLAIGEPWLALSDQQVGIRRLACVLHWTQSLIPGWMRQGVAEVLPAMARLPGLSVQVDLRRVFDVAPHDEGLDRCSKAKPI
jgi:hypothetical protein